MFSCGSFWSSLMACWPGGRDGFESAMGHACLAVGLFGLLCWPDGRDGLESVMGCACLAVGLLGLL